MLYNFICSFVIDSTTLFVVYLNLFFSMSEVKARMNGFDDVMWYGENVEYLYSLNEGQKTFDLDMKVGLICDGYAKI